MNILFLTVVKIKSLEEGGIFPDLLRKFRDEGHKVFVMSPTERRDKLKTHLIEENNTKILKVKTLNIQKANLIEKGFATLAIEGQYLRALKSNFSEEKFDLVLYSTPPITFSKVIDYVKRKDGAFSYLLLKDIFPQNAVDMAMIKKGSILHRIFEKKEKKLYQISDKIGCMSKANVDFIVNNNPEIDISKLEINPNSIIPRGKGISEDEAEDIKRKYGLPLDKKIFVYGGNLGKPQGLSFLIQTINEIKDENIFFLVVGSGTRYNYIKSFFDSNDPKNAKLLRGLPKKDYDKLLSACDVGMIFLHKDFTIPNFPGRLLSYLEMKMPIIAATDPNTDVGEVIEKNNCGYWLESGDIVAMKKAITNIISDKSRYIEMKENAWKLLKDEYTVDRSYKLIVSKVKNV
ncbi:glycosyltransferase family 4 protein [Tenacibaculum sp. 190524A05c]|uniref:Glycosyltransferase WbuB n=1 Tax=Tenacibaculum platacis TaxID=3137852 RepID=A0ABM9P459_9FLAO